MFFSVFKFRLFPYSVPMPVTLIFLISKYFLLWKKNRRKWLKTINNRNWGPAEGASQARAKRRRTSLLVEHSQEPRSEEVHIPCQPSVSHRAQLQIDPLESTIISSEKHIYINAQAELTVLIHSLYAVRKHYSDFTIYGFTNAPN